ncbi:MAG: DeoR/GlpR family DNA-binding transcription regulator [Buchananella hordeovulneris]|nr:DeoR/GlpR family DNA-binding transcription regulator [Buchananella hordeovulneris]
MNRHERLNRLLDLIVENGSVRIEEIIDRLEISAATARRDLDTLSAQQLITRTRGGASVNPTSADLPLRYRATRRADEKTRIAQEAVKLLQPGSVIALNGGTTTTEVSREIGSLSTRNPEFERDPVTVVTNAINIANELTVRQNVRVVVTGGVVRARSFELVGPLAERILPAISAGTLFLGVNALHPERGAFADHDGEATVNAALVKASERVVVVADSSKLDRTDFTRICNTGDIHDLITDSGADPEVVRRIRDAGVRVTLA